MRRRQAACASGPATQNAPIGTGPSEQPPHRVASIQVRAVTGAAKCCAISTLETMIGPDGNATLRRLRWAAVTPKCVSAYIDALHSPQ
jgi:hypothetical protein